jgi:hypothetical protein
VENFVSSLFVTVKICVKIKWRCSTENSTLNKKYILKMYILVHIKLWHLVALLRLTHGIWSTTFLFQTYSKHPVSTCNDMESV